jgi:ergothioneine biosynthesis protein EgtB
MQRSVLTTAVSDVDPLARQMDLVRRYDEIRSLTELLAAPLLPEDQVAQSMPDASPTKWHQAHTTWFFETFLLSEQLPGYQVFHPMFGYLFNSYYDAVGARHPRPARGLLTRPTLDEVAEYRHNVDAAMHELLDRPLSLSLLDLVELGINHEQQHQELLLMDAKHLLSLNPMRPVYLPRQAHASAMVRPLGWRAFPGGLVSIGHDGPGFAFDNELAPHRAYLGPYALGDRPATCGEWMEFMGDGGYERPELWLSEGWGKVQSERWRAPLYWFEGDGDWRLFTLGGERAVAHDEPVCHVSYYEADAFARWTGARLPTEFEWEVAVGDALPSGHMLDLGELHPCSGDGSTMLFGEVWEWTSSAYLPYPRFRTAPGAVGEYNGKFMVNQQVLRGGCCVTPWGHVRSTYRNFFPPTARWAFSGVRLARDV